MSLSSVDLSENTLVSKVMERIRRRILSGDLAPGERIDQDGIAEQLGVSRMPVREALIKLAETGYVIVRPYRGAIVAGLSKSQIEETYLIRSRLETLAARIAATCMNDNEIKKLEAILAQAEAAIREDRLNDVFELNRAFHRTGYEVTNLKRLCKLIEQLRDKSEIFRRHHARLKERVWIAYEEHKKILEAWREGDPVAAEYWTQMNLENSSKALLDNLLVNDESLD